MKPSSPGSRGASDVRQAAARERKIALLVDGDSAPASLAGQMIAEAAKFGAVVIRRVYGNYGSPTMNNWTKAGRDHALESRHHTPAISGKNATDLALAIDAMEILCEGVVGGFCIVSSDSDFTGLVTRLRAKGKLVLGIGRIGTPATFQQACDTFVLIETLIALEPSRRVAPLAKTPKPKLAKSRAKTKSPVRSLATHSEGGALASRPVQSIAGALPLLVKAFEIAATEEGFAHMANIGGVLHRLDPSFDHRAYGKRQLIDLVKAFPGDFTVERREPEAGGGVIVRRARD